MRANPLGVLATHSQNRGVQAALMSFAVTDDGELIVDTEETSRKADNLLADPRVAAVIGTGDESLQVECHARVVSGDEREKYEQIFDEQLPDAHRVAPEESMFVVLRPHWLRYYDATGSTARIVQGRQVWMC